MFRSEFGSIRFQLMRLAALSAASALAVACAAFALHESRMLSTAKRQSMHRDAAVLAKNSAAALQRADWVAAEEHLSVLQLEPTVTAACLYDAHGAVRAAYSRLGQTSPHFPSPEDRAWLRAEPDNQLELFQPIHHEGRRVGSLFLSATRDDIEQQRAAYPMIVGAVFLISLAASTAFAMRMQRSIAAPIEMLSRTAERISEDGDYTVRVHGTPSGQLGDLCRAFNAMLNRIDKSDRDLQDAHDKLNTRVRERTRELHREVLERRYAESIASGQSRVLQQLATGKPLAAVLLSLMTEIESHLRLVRASISLVESEGEWLADPISVQLDRRESDGLSHLPISSGGTAPARAVALKEPQFDRCGADGSPTAECGFDTTGHGGACWAAPVVTADGRVQAVITLFHRHDRVPNEEELELVASATSLASLAIEQRLSEEVLKETMRRATTANRAKSDFLANMSHEIRTPLNAILGFTNLLLAEDEGLRNDQREHLTTIASSGKHLLGLINDVLDLSKIEATELTVDPEPTNPNDVLVEVTSLLRVRAQEKGIDLDTEWLSPPPELITTDPARLRQLLMNLIGNAVKFTDRGGVRVCAALEPQGDAPTTLRFDVVDTGIGIAEDKLQEIFNPFAQADASVTRRFGGTGLGLAICRRLTGALGGELTVESEIGRGSCFTLRLPTGPLDDVELSPASEGTRSIKQSELGSNEAAGLDGVRVLVVDDVDTNRRLIRLLLARFGVVVEVAQDGNQGVEKALASHFDVILMDMQMPVMDGYSATARLRESGYAGPIVALTANAMKEDKQRCLDSGCSDYLTKPIDPDALLQKLTSVTESPSVPTARSGELVASLLPTDDEEFREVVEDFLDRLEAALPEMVALADRGDWDELKSKAHWLRGCGGTAGYPTLSEGAASLEACLKGEPNVDAVQEELESLIALQRRLVVKNTHEPV